MPISAKSIGADSTSRVEWSDRGVVTTRIYGSSRTEDVQHFVDLRHKSQLTLPLQALGLHAFVISAGEQNESGRRERRCNRRAPAGHCDRNTNRLVAYIIRLGWQLLRQFGALQTPLTLHFCFIQRHLMAFELSKSTQNAVPHETTCVVTFLTIRLRIESAAEC